ncbi:MAG: type II toxin-antitoxin system RelE/ParE family toxin [Deltaproteobacteria bacterium]|nr:type II toxin-antitoxin system RelE/ParE family toxin [Deltaproteobacteria bacterium]
MKLVYAQEAKTRIRALSPDIKKGIKESLEKLAKDPYLGKPLQRELIGFWTLAFKRYRIIYKLDSSKIHLNIYTIGRRENIYEDFTQKVKMSSI